MSVPTYTREEPRGSTRTTVAGTSGSAVLPVPDMVVQVGVAEVALVVLKRWNPPLGPWWLVAQTVPPLASPGSKAALERGCQAVLTTALVLQAIEVAPTV